jgi:hypothetical protein
MMVEVEAGEAGDKEGRIARPEVAGIHTAFLRLSFVCTC